MINMIKADLYRIFKNVGIYIALAIMILTIGLSIYLVTPGTVGQMSVGDISTVQSAELPLTYEELESLSISEFREKMLSVEGYALDRDMLTTNMNMYYVFIFVAALAVTIDFSSGSVKNTLTSAISKRKYFLSKTVIIFGICIIFFFLNTYISYFANLIFNGKNLSSSLWTVTSITLVQLPAALALISILSGIAFMARKTAVYNMVTIPFVMVFQLLMGAAVKVLGLNQKYVYYELQIMFGKLANNPSDSYMIKSYIVCAVIIALFNIAGYVVFRKAEIK